MDSRSSSGSFFSGFLSENIINMPVVEWRGFKSNYVMYELGHEYVCNHRRQRITHIAFINLFVQILIEEED